MKTFEDFATAVGERESGGRYDAKNELNYLGKYQFGLARLTDMGLCERIPGTTGFSNKSFRWIPPHSEAEFLSSPAIQDAIFKRHVDDLRRQLRRFESGLVAGAHLLGVGGIRELIFEGRIGKDANGTAITSYVSRFSNFEL
jgi:hypothetical protein